MERRDLKYLLKNNTEVIFRNPDSGELVSFPTEEVAIIIAELEYEADKEQEFQIVSEAGSKMLSYDQGFFQGYYNGEFVFESGDSFFKEPIEKILAIYPIKS